jgi:IclR family acetate operon transcriptional repressor
MGGPATLQQRPLTETQHVGDRPGYPIESVDRALTLLLALEETGSLTVAEAGDLLGASRSTAHRLLKMLQYRGFVRQDPRTRTYVGGPAILRIGLAAVNQLDIRALARPTLEAIVGEVDETAHLVVLQRADALFLDCVEGGKAIRAAARTGTSLPAHSTAGGKALLARLPEARLDALLAETRLPALTPYSLTSARALKKDLERVRERGYAVNDRESEIGLRAVAAVIAQAPERLSMDAAITVSGPDSRITEDRIPEIAEVLLAHVGSPS